MTSSLQSRLRTVGPELGLLLAGIALRIRFGSIYEPTWGYDWHPHWGYLEHVFTTGEVPDPSLNTAAYHPPLYYWIGALLMKSGAGPQGIQALSIGAGIARLVITFIGFRIVLPSHRLARCVALALAGVLPCALHGDGMVTNESLNALFGTLALVLGIKMLTSQGRARLGHAAAFAVALGAALLTKISCVILVPLVAVVALVQSFARGGRLAERARSAAIPIGALAVALAISVPVYVHHHRTSPSILATGFECMPYYQEELEELEETPYLERRTLGYLVGAGDERFWMRPVYPSEPSRFWPILIASTFGDYLNYHFGGPMRPGEDASVISVEHPVPLFAWLRASVIAGVPIVFATLAAMVVVAWRSFRARDALAFLLLGFPLLAVAGQLHFSIRYPFDEEGMIKAHYMVFAAGPLFGLFGLAVSAAWSFRWWSKPIALGLLAAFGVVASYTLMACFG